MLDAVLAEAGKHRGSRVTNIRLLVGEAAGVVPDCVSFYFDRMKEGTAAEGAELEFRRVATRLRCPKCGAEFGDITDMCACNAGAEIVSGQELMVESIEIEEE
jgi:hydrogenase nickel incorporation protein HypA/HybF